MAGFVFFVILAAIAAFLVIPYFKGYRTQVFGWIVAMGGAVVPLLTQVFEYLQTLDWRQYILEGDRKNMTVLAITGGIGVLIIVLRFMTTGPVGHK